MSPHQNRMRALTLLDDAEVLKTKASVLAADPDGSVDEVMALLTIAHVSAAMAAVHVSLAELDSRARW